MSNPNYWDSLFPEPDPDNLDIPDTPYELFPGTLGLADKLGYARAAQITEMLAMGHLVEAGKLIVGDESLNEAVPIVDMGPRRPFDRDDPLNS